MITEEQSKQIIQHFDAILQICGQPTISRLIQEVSGTVPKEALSDFMSQVNVNVAGVLSESMTNMTKEMQSLMNNKEFTDRLKAENKAMNESNN